MESDSVHLRRPDAVPMEMRVISQGCQPRGVGGRPVRWWRRPINTTAAGPQEERQTKNTSDDKSSARDLINTTLVDAQSPYISLRNVHTLYLRIINCCALTPLDFIVLHCGKNSTCVWKAEFGLVRVRPPCLDASRVSLTQVGGLMLYIVGVRRSPGFYMT